MAPRTAIGSRILIVVAIALLPIQHWRQSLAVSAPGLLAELLSRWILDPKLPAMYEQRPRITEQDRIGTPAPMVE